MEPLIFKGASGTPYTYCWAGHGWKWSAVPANYMFAKWIHGNNWFISYIGQCQDASNRIPSHERWLEAFQKYGSVWVLNHVSHPDQSIREMEERDLIRAIAPPLNVQHKPPSLADLSPVRGSTVLTAGVRLAHQRSR